MLPVVLGDGVGLFGRSSGRELLFDIIDVGRVGQSAILHVRRRRSPHQSSAG